MAYGGDTRIVTHKCSQESTNLEEESEVGTLISTQIRCRQGAISVLWAPTLPSTWSTVSQGLAGGQLTKLQRL